MGTDFFATGLQKKMEKIGEDFLRLRLPLGARGALGAPQFSEHSEPCNKSPPSFSSKMPPPLTARGAARGGVRICASLSANLLRPAGRSRAPPLPSLGRIRTALQILNAERFYRNNLKVTTIKFGVP